MTWQPGQALGLETKRFRLRSLAPVNAIPGSDRDKVNRETVMQHCTGAGD